MLVYYLAGIPLVFVLSWAVMLIFGLGRIFSKEKKRIALAILLTTVGWPLLVFMVALALTADPSSTAQQDR